MQLDITPESTLKQLKQAVNTQSLEKMTAILSNTKGAQKFFKHLFTFNDELAHLDAFVGPSNSVDYLKIKYHGDTNSDAVQEFHDAVNHFASKYKVKVVQVDTKPTYYLHGMA